ncbi:MAG: single-stranded DNA-binding protein [Lautropia sp.]|nr:single-stranded DNA-binding protein [Lautropia sp.]
MLNTVQLIGHLGRQPEVRYLPSGDPVVNVSLATTDKWTDRATGERREHTEWHRVAFFGRLAEIAGQYLHKGALVFVSGQLRTHTWTDSDGVERYTTDVRAETLRMLGSRQSAPAEAGQTDATARPRTRARQQPPVTGNGFDDMTDDIPF